MTSSPVRTALANPNELERTAGLAPILASLDAENLDAIVGAYEATFTNVGPGAVAVELLAEAWSKIDPAGAIERIRGWKPYRQNMAVPALMRSWARRDPPAARAALETIQPEELRDKATTAMILGWAESGDPAVWDSYVAGLPFGRAAAYDLMRLLGAREGVDALLRRAENVPEDTDDRFRAHALQNAVEIAAQIDPERAAAFAEQHRGEGGGLERIVAMRWATSDGPRAMEWAQSRPDPVREPALRAAFEYWLWSDRLAALDWAGNQPDPMVAGVLDLYANALGKTEPGGRSRSAPASQTRPNGAEPRRLAQAWLAQQPEVAAAWLEQNGLADLVRRIGAPPMPERSTDGGAQRREGRMTFRTLASSRSQSSRMRSPPPGALEPGTNEFDQWIPSFGLSIGVIRQSGSAFQQNNLRPPDDTFPPPGPSRARHRRARLPGRPALGLHRRADDAGNRLRPDAPAPVRPR